MSVSTLGVPVFGRIDGASVEAVAGISAEASVFAGKVTWQLTLLDLVERFLFAENKVVGFFVIDAARRSICHRFDSGEYQEIAMFDLMQAAAEAVAYERYTLHAVGGAPACAWEFRRADGTLLNPAIVPPFVGALSLFEASIVDAVKPVQQQLAVTALLLQLDVAFAGGFWIALASQTTGTITVWSTPTELADFTEAELGHTLLDASFGYRARIEEP